VIKNTFVAVLIELCIVSMCTAQSASHYKPDPTVAEWLDTVRNQTGPRRDFAAYALRDPGPRNASNAVQTLIDALSDKDSFIRRAAVIAMGEIRHDPDRMVPALVEHLSDVDQDVRENAAIALGKIGPPAVPRLVKLLVQDAAPADPSRSASALQRDDIRIADMAAVSLTEIGTSALPALIKTVRKEKNARPYALFLIRRAGRPAYPTVLKTLRDPDPEVAAFAVEAVASISGDRRAIPFLSRMLRSPSETLRRKAGYALAAIGIDGDHTLDTALKDPNLAVRRQAAKSLERTHPDSAFVVSVLAEAVKDRSILVRREAIRVLHNIGPSAAPAAIPALVEGLKDSDAGVRAGAADVLWSYGEAGAEAVPALIAATTDPDQNVRRSAIRALPSNGGTAEIIHALTKSLQDPLVATGAAEALGTLGTVAKSAIPELRRAAKDSQRFRPEMLYTLGRLKADDEESIAFISDALADPDPNVALAAATSLRAIGPNASGALPALVRALGSKKGFGYEVVVEALTNIGPAAIPALMDALRDHNPDLRAYAARGLAPMVSTDASVGRALMAALSDSNAHVRSNAAESLAKTDVMSEEVIAALIGLLRDPAAPVRAASAAALGKAGIKATSARSVLPELLDDSDWWVRQMVLDALSKIGVGPSEMTMLLVPKLGAPDDGVRRTARIALVSLGSIALPAVRDALNDPNETIRQEAAKVAEEIDARSHPLETSIRRLKDPKASVRKQAAETLRRLGSDATPAAPALIDAMSDHDTEVRTSAAVALVATGIDLGGAAGEVSAILAEDYVRRIFDSEVYSLIEEVRPEPIEPSAAAMDTAVDQLPHFPWPPPRFSAWDVLPRKMFGERALLLGYIYDRLSGSLTKAGFEDQALFEVPEGFAIVTRVERIHEDGSAWGTSDRWSSGKIPLQSLDLAEYLRRLFLERPGQFRLLVFVVTTEQIIPATEQPIAETKARELIMRGGRVLPDRIRRLPFRDHFCHVLIYHFEKRIGEGAVIRYPSPLSPQVHLAKTGVLNYLQP